MKKKIKRSGSMWKLYGFTKTHIWGVRIVGGLLMAVGAGLLTAAIILINEISSVWFYKLISISLCAFIGGIATVMGSILTLIFYLGAHKLGLLEEKQQQTEPKH